MSRRTLLALNHKAFLLHSLRQIKKIKLSKMVVGNYMGTYYSLLKSLRMYTHYHRIIPRLLDNNTIFYSTVICDFHFNVGLGKNNFLKVLLSVADNPFLALHFLLNY